MNTDLREVIVRHILSSFAVIPSSFVNLDKTRTLKHKDFLLQETISFTDEQGSLIKNKIWGCQFTIEGKEMRILLGDCSQDNSLPEYALLVSMKESPSYGVYLIDEPQSRDSLIGCSLDNKNWMECQTYLQATFLAGMEQMKDVNVQYTKCTDYKDQYRSLLSFIKFHNLIYEAKYL